MYGGVDSRRLSGDGRTIDAEATFVAMVSVAVTAFVPFGVSVEGEKVQVLAAGSPEQAKETC